MKNIIALWTKKEEITTNVNQLDERSSDYLKKFSIPRSNFSYEVLSDVSWWPDEIVTFLEVLRLAYCDFINLHITKAALFDSPIRNAIYFMNQKPYSNDEEIKRFLIGANFEICDNYLNRMISEDNCYMYELEDRNRSPNEKKHYYLSRALKKLMSFCPIVADDLMLKKEYEELVRVYTIIYDVRTMYAVIDDMLRNVVRGAIKGNILGINLNNSFRELIAEIDESLVPQLGKHHDDNLFNNVHLFRDLLLVASYRTSQFNHIFNHKPDIGKESSKKQISYLINTELSFFDNETIKRIEYVYNYYLNSLINRSLKNDVIKGAIDFNSMLLELKGTIPDLLSPRYSRNSTSLKDSSVNYFIIDINKERKKPSKIRQHSTASLRQSHTGQNPLSPREDF